MKEAFKFGFGFVTGGVLGLATLGAIVDTIKPVMCQIRIKQTSKEPTQPKHANSNEVSN